MDLGRAVVTSVVLGAVAYVLPRLAYLALEKDKMAANHTAMEMIFKEEEKKSPVYRGESGTLTKLPPDPRPSGMYL